MFPEPVAGCPNKKKVDVEGQMVSKRAQGNTHSYRAEPQGSHFLSPGWGFPRAGTL